MESAYIRLKFIPVVKHFPRANSNDCWLEITPTISCIENLDKIEWSQQKGSVEYIVPMTYKIIVKREPEQQIKVYYSCIDMLSSVSRLDFSAGDIHRPISDNVILSNAFTKNVDIKINSREHDIKKKNNKQVTNTIKDRQTELQYKSIEIDSVKTATKSKFDNSNSKDKSHSICNLNADNKNTKNQQKKLCITKVCNINTSDDIMLCNNCTKTNFSSNSINSLSNIQTKNIKFMENRYTPCRDDLYKCYVRVEPEIRVAQFVEKMEEEVFPIKVLINDLLLKCARLGLNKIMRSNVAGIRQYESSKNKCFEVQKELQSNRVVYSMVFES